jgi:hypothetical protein
VARAGSEIYTRRMWRRTFSVAAALVCALVVPAFAAAAIVGSTHLSLTPGNVRPDTNVVVSFRQPSVTGLLPGMRTVETLTVTGPLGASWAGGDDVTLQPGAAGTLMSRTLRPAALSHRWCAGLHRVALTISQSTGCRVGVARHVCPEYAIVPDTVATASFRVTAH